MHFLLTIFLVSSFVCKTQSVPDGNSALISYIERGNIDKAFEICSQGLLTPSLSSLTIQNRNVATFLLDNHASASLDLMTCLLESIELKMSSKVANLWLHLASGVKHTHLVVNLLQKTKASLTYFDDFGASALQVLANIRMVTLDLTHYAISRANPMQIQDMISYYINFEQELIPALPAKTFVYELKSAIKRILAHTTLKKSSLSTLTAFSRSLAYNDIAIFANARATSGISILLQHLMEKSSLLRYNVTFPLQYLLSKDRHGRTVFHYASISGNTPALFLLLHAHKQAVSFLSEDSNSIKLPKTTKGVLSMNDLLGFSPIELACIYGNVNSAKFLAKRINSLLPSYCNMTKGDNQSPIPPFPSKFEKYLVQNSTPMRSHSNESSAGGWDSPVVITSKYAFDSLEFFSNKNKDRVRCDLPILDLSNATNEEVSEIFLHAGYLRNQPLVFRNYAATATPIKQLFERTTLLSSPSSSLPFLVSPIPYGKKFGETTTAVSIHDYVASMYKVPANYTFEDRHKFLEENSSPGYIFDTPSSGKNSKNPNDNKYTGYSDSLVQALLQGFNLSLPLLHSQVPTLKTDGSGIRANSISLTPAADYSLLWPQFYVGPPGSGAPIHYHKDAVNLLAYGLKKWFLFPQTKSFYSTIPIAEWVSTSYIPRKISTSDAVEVPPLAMNEHTNEQVLSALNRTTPDWPSAGLPIECTQFPGDALYVPLGWGHGVLNLETSIGVAIEYSTALGHY
jgi:hypothetical protein